MSGPRLAAAAIGSGIVFTVGWVVAGSLSGSADSIDGTLSDLGARTADVPWLWNGARAVSGALLVAVALGMRARLPRGRDARVATALLALLGVAEILGGLLFHTDCLSTEAGCGHDRTYSWRHLGHEFLSPFGSVGLVVALVLFARTFRDAPPLRGLHRATIATLVLFVATLAVYVERAGDAGAGIVQRVSATVVYAWIVFAAVRLGAVEPAGLRSSERPRPRVRRKRRPPAPRAPRP